MGGQYIRITSGGNNLPLSGGTGGPYTFTGGTYANGNFSATTIYSGSTDLSELFGNIAIENYLPLSGGTGGPYAFTGGTYNEGSLTATTDVHISKRATFDVYTDSFPDSGADGIINLRNGSLQLITITGDTSLRFQNALPGTYVIMLEEDANGGHAITLASSSGWYTRSGSQPSFTTTANALNVLTIVYDGTRMWVTSSQNHQEV